QPGEGRLRPGAAEHERRARAARGRGARAMRLLGKVGGAQLEEDAGRRDLARALARARDAGHAPILVHGRGNQIRSLTRGLGRAGGYVDGLRVTDAETADVVLMTLGGLVNRQLVAALQAHGVPAVGLTGADGLTFTAARHAVRGEDLGYVGTVHEVRPGLVETLLARGFGPVIGTIAPLDPGQDAPGDRFYNVNADHACGPLARAFGAGAVLFLSDVPGVLDGGRRIERLTAARCAELRAAGTIAAGMIPKV